MIGQMLAHYEITASLGAGGMGDVYRAHDTKLKRDVAIKVLPAAFVDDDNRRARFEREAELLASLNHPNIAQIYGIEKLDDEHALVIELVEGPTLADRIEQGPIPVDEALEIAGQIANALEAAHGQGIIHRDLKPANIKLKPDGTVKVLDFGIAKAIESRTTSERMAPALTSPAQTEAGIVLGTAAYMSPEQARGKPVDQRTDIWAFGCVLYEMLTGQPTFAGEDRTSTLARVLEREPNTSALPRTLAPRIPQTIRLCLEKDVRKRVADIRDVRLAIEGTFDTGPIAALEGSKPSARRSLAAAAAGLIAGGLVFGFGTHWLAPEPPAPPARLEVLVPESTGYGGRVAGFVSRLAVSPNGRQAVIEGGMPEARIRDRSSPLWLWTFASGEVRPLTGTQGAQGPFWSADGRAIGFYSPDPGFSHFELARGTVVSIPDTESLGSIGAWSARDDILFTSLDGALSRTSPTGRKPTAVTAGESLLVHDEHAVFLPDQRHFLYYHHNTGDRAASGILLADIEAAPQAQPRTPLVIADDGPAFVADADGRGGYLLYVRDQTLIARRFDIRRSQLTGDELPLAALPGQNLGGEHSVTTSQDGSIIIYEPALDSDPTAGESTVPTATLTWVSGDGTRTPFGTSANSFVNVRVAPDNRTIAATLRGDDGSAQPMPRIWLSSVERPGLTQYLTDKDDAVMVFGWSDDGESIVFGRDFNSVWAAPIAGDFSEARKLVQTSPGQWMEPLDSETLLYADLGAGPRGESSIGVINVADEEARFTPILRRAQAMVANPAVNPDRNLIAYQSNESGEIQVYAERFPGGGGKVLVSNDGSSGGMPVFSYDGTELYYLRFDDGAMMAVAVADAATLSFGLPRKLFDGEGMRNAAPLPTAIRSWDIAPDGRFLMISDIAPAADANESGAQAAEPETSPQPRIIIFQNLLKNLQD